MNIFNDIDSGTILIGVLVLWFFVGKIVNSISESKKLNDGEEKENTKHGKENENQKCPFCAEEIKIEAIIDESLIGGLIVKVGSKMIDSSIRSKLTNLQNIMKEV